MAKLLSMTCRSIRIFYLKSYKFTRPNKLCNKKGMIEIRSFRVAKSALRKHREAK